MLPKPRWEVTHYGQIHGKDQLILTHQTRLGVPRAGGRGKGGTGAEAPPGGVVGYYQEQPCGRVWRAPPGGGKVGIAVTGRANPSIPPGGARKRKGSGKRFNFLPANASRESCLGDALPCRLEGTPGGALWGVIRSGPAGGLGGHRQAGGKAGNAGGAPPGGIVGRYQGCPLQLDQSSQGTHHRQQNPNCPSDMHGPGLRNILFDLGNIFFGFSP